MKVYHTEVHLIFGQSVSRQVTAAENLPNLRTEGLLSDFLEPAISFLLLLFFLRLSSCISVHYFAYIFANTFNCSWLILRIEEKIIADPVSNEK